MSYKTCAFWYLYKRKQREAVRLYLMNMKVEGPQNRWNFELKQVNLITTADLVGCLPSPRAGFRGSCKGSKWQEQYGLCELLQRTHQTSLPSPGPHTEEMKEREGSGENGWKQSQEFLANWCVCVCIILKRFHSCPLQKPTCKWEVCCFVNLPEENYLLQT